MKIHIPQFIEKTGREVSLSETERERLQNAVKEYMAMKPRREPNTVRAGYSFVSVFSMRTVAAGLVVALIFSGTGISYAAESSVPGDVLYPIKVSVNEEVVAALAVSTEAKAEWETERMERRLEEAAQLSIAGVLTPEAQRELTARFERHSENAVVDVESLEESDAGLALDLAQGLEARLFAHEALLRDLDGESDELAERVRGKIERVSSSRVRSEGKFAFSDGNAVARTVDVGTALSLMTATETPAPEAAAKASVSDSQSDDSRKKAAERMKKSAAKAVEKASAAYAKVSQKLNDNERVRIEAQIIVANELVDSGDNSLGDGDYPTAFRSYQEAYGIAQKLAVFLKAGRSVDVRVRNFPLPTFDVHASSERDRGRGSSEAEDEIEHGVEIESEIEHPAGDDSEGTRSDERATSSSGHGDESGKDDGGKGDDDLEVKINLSL